jgi:hypothetical protein
MTSIDHPFARNNLFGNEAKAVRMRDPLPRLLTRITARAGEHAVIVQSASRPWSSALFEGRRHIIVLRIEGSDARERAAAFAADVGEAEWTLSGHFVADITVDARWRDEGAEVLELSALTIEDW